MKNKQLEKKNDMAEIKKTLQGINSRLEEAEIQITE